MTNQETTHLCVMRGDFLSHDPFTGFRQLANKTDFDDYMAEGGAQFLTIQDAEAGSHMPVTTFALVCCDGKILIHDRIGGGVKIGVGSGITKMDGITPDSAFIGGTIEMLDSFYGIKIDDKIGRGMVAGLANVEDGRLYSVVIVNITMERSLKVLLDAKRRLVNARFVPIEELSSDDLLPTLCPVSKVIAEFFNKEHQENGKWHDPAFRNRMGMFSYAASTVGAAACEYLVMSDPAAFVSSRTILTKELGKLKVILSQILAHKDVDPEEVDREAKEFHRQLTESLGNE